MSNKYLKPMLDPGSPRVFNCNELTHKILEANPDAVRFFRNKALNDCLLIKDTVPASERGENTPLVGTKLYFPFNVTNIYEGGRTIFVHDKRIAKAITEHYGEGAIHKEALDEDLRIISILDKLPSLDPFLMKDVFLRQKIEMNNEYFQVSEEVWNEIEKFMLQRFEPLVQAAFPNISSSDDKARQLIDKIWEARDIVALQPLITGFRLPQDEALNIFSSWRGIVYYSYQYQRGQANFVELVKWLKTNEAPAGVPASESKDVIAQLNVVKEQLRQEWQKIEGIVREYQDSYDKMFKYKISSNEFLAFLRNSGKTYWDLGNSLGKINHAIYCWDATTSRFDNRKLPWAQFQEVTRILSTVFQAEKKTTTNVAWQ